MKIALQHKWWKEHGKKIGYGLYISRICLTVKSHYDHSAKRICSIAFWLPNALLDYAEHIQKWALFIRQTDGQKCLWVLVLTRKLRVRIYKRETHIVSDVWIGSRERVSSYKTVNRIAVRHFQRMNQTNRCIHNFDITLAKLNTKLPPLPCTIDFSLKMSLSLIATRPEYVNFQCNVHISKFEIQTPFLCRTTIDIQCKIILKFISTCGWNLPIIFICKQHTRKCAQVYRCFNRNLKQQQKIVSNRSTIANALILLSHEIEFYSPNYGLWSH